ncbi:hypothetical protein FACS1894206_09860 [Deltaproteobacteria bacterium]|nr:hypothetical protein FACS1894206_09860 [Deltaproteobacteria bacterium]
MADLSPLRRFLPLIGARFSHSLPHSNALPGSVEASGFIPDHVIVPASLPTEGLVALLCATAAWKKQIFLDAAEVPDALWGFVLETCLPFLRAVAVKDSVSGTTLALDAREVSLPDAGTGADLCPLDPILSAYLLALPLFAGGEAQLNGAWEENSPTGKQVIALLTACGLGVRIDKETDKAGIHTSFFVKNVKVNLERPDYTHLDEALVPLALAIVAQAVCALRKEIPLPAFPPQVDGNVVENFFSHLGLALREGVVWPTDKGKEEGKEGKKTPWTSPGAVWAFAYALCAYLSPHIGLTNPFVVTSRMPSFWSLYNALPNPSSAIKKTPDKQENTHRRILTK